MCSGLCQKEAIALCINIIAVLLSALLNKITVEQLKFNVNKAIINSD